MNRLLKLWQTAGFVFTGIAGTLLHFLYDWTGGSVIAAPFSAINESIWEHMKLLFVPMFVFALFEYRFTGRKYENFWFAQLSGIVAGLLIIPAMYYTYTGAFGVDADWFNIVIFFISAACAYYIQFLIMKHEIGMRVPSVVCFALLCVIGIMFVVFTFAPPSVPLFREP